MADTACHRHAPLRPSLPRTEPAPAAASAITAEVDGRCRMCARLGLRPNYEREDDDRKEEALGGVDDDAHPCATEALCRVGHEQPGHDARRDRPGLVEVVRTHQDA